MPTVRWTPNDAMLGIQIRWSVHAHDALPSFGTPVDLDASLGEYEIDVVVPTGALMTVGVTPYPEFDAGSVDGEPGWERYLRMVGGGDDSLPSGARDLALDVARRVTFDNDGDLIYDNEWTLTMARP
jgi:hypothetical protein